MAITETARDTHPEAAAPEALDPALRTTAAIVVLGAITTVLDATIVSIAIDRLAGEFGATLTGVQWVMTGYLLALTAVIPATGWAVDRYGARTVWLTALGLFLAGSVLCGVSGSMPALIASRVVQGLGGGMVVPVGMTLLAQAAGPRRMGRAMSVVGVPMMLGPILGPVIGGLVVGAVSWRWIFFLNVPVVLAAMAFSLRHIDGTPGRRSERFDALGAALLSPGLAGLVYGVSEAARGSAGTVAYGSLIGGVVLLGAFAAHALRGGHGDRPPLLDLRNFGRPGFAIAAAVLTAASGVLMGGMFLLPLYYQQVHGLDPLGTGLLLIPQGAGAALTLTVAGRLVDRGLGKSVVLTGLPVLAAGLAGYTQADAGLVVPTVALLVVGLGTGCLMSPLTAMAYAVLDRAAIPRATATLNVLQRLAGALGTAVFAVVLQGRLRDAGQAADAVADAFRTTFWLPVAAVAIATALALFLPARSTTPAPEGRNRTEDPS
ncbi:MAG: DHA2 family efflux MFS transporter permease subunit [Streptosporangiales bacterium]|nr:DHA2 family efflux MFS transporter permease subunit [Streptosporangiales bacterium]